MSYYEVLLRAAESRGADDLAATVAAGAGAFEAIRAAADDRADAADDLFAAAMMTAAEAADGRDWLTSSPLWPSAQTAATNPAMAWCQDIAALAETLAAVLRGAAARPGHPDDVRACERAAGCADRIRGLVAGDTS
jgi:hypothetical protein